MADEILPKSEVSSPVVPVPDSGTTNAQQNQTQKRGPGDNPNNKKSKKKARTKNFLGPRGIQVISKAAVIVNVRDIPRNLNIKRLSSIMRKNTPVGIRQPCLLRLYSRAYKVRRQDKPPEWVGHAYFALQSKSDADSIMSMWHEKELAPGFLCKVEIKDDFLEPRNPHACKEAAELWDEEGKSCDPTIERQLSHLNEEDLLERMSRIDQENQESGEAASAALSDKVVPGEEVNWTARRKAMASVCRHLRANPRPVSCLEGALVPPDLLKPVMDELVKPSLWPTVSHRSAVNAENYIVIKVSGGPPGSARTGDRGDPAPENKPSSSSSSSTSAEPSATPMPTPTTAPIAANGQGDSQRPSTRSNFDNTNTSTKTILQRLEKACLSLVWAAEPGYPVSAIAITKNFLGSPHIDIRDTRYQYALSLGEFEGGQLCVEEIGGMCARSFFFFLEATEQDYIRGIREREREREREL